MALTQALLLILCIYVWSGLRPFMRTCLVSNNLENFEDLYENFVITKD